MKVRREILIIFSMILLLVLPATSLGKEIKWVLERPVIPVLVKKPASPVLKVTLIRADNQPYTIQQIDLDLLGSRCGSVSYPPDSCRLPSIPAESLPARKASTFGSG